MSGTNISLENLQRFIKECFIAVDFSEQQATKCANLMAKADLMGQDGHGIFRLPQYIKRIKSGGLNTSPNINIIEDRTAMALLDGDNGMVHLVMS